jgi:hypothetical protein
MYTLDRLATFESVIKCKIIQRSLTGPGCVKTQNILDYKNLIPKYM